MTNVLATYLDTHATEAQTLLETLCRQPSVAAQNAGMTEMAAVVEAQLRAGGFMTQRLQIEGAPPIVYGEQRGRSPFTLLLYNHYDVQPAEPFDLWRSPPFAPEVRDGNLYARGTSDNKGEFAARLAAIHALRAVDGELPITVRWIIEGEEEIGSTHFGQIIEPHAALLQADGVLWEGCGFDPEGRPQFCVGFKGLLYVQLDVALLKIDAHSGYAPSLPSAAWRLVQALATLRTGEGRVRLPGFYDPVRLPTAAQRAALEDLSDFEAFHRAYFGVERFMDGLTGMALRERYSFTPTCNIAGLHSGYTDEGVKTVLPARAMAKIDCRLVPDQHPQAIGEALRAYLVSEGYGDVGVTVLGESVPVVTPLEDPFVQHVASIAGAFEGKRATVLPIHGGTLPFLKALHHHVRAPGLSAPGNPVYEGSGPHAPNEHIRLEDLARAVRFNCHLFRALGEP